MFEKRREKVILGLFCISLVGVGAIGWELEKMAQEDCSKDNAILSEEWRELEKNLTVHIADVRSNFRLLEKNLQDSWLRQNYQDYQELFENDTLDVEEKVLFAGLSGEQWQEQREAFGAIAKAYLNEEEKDEYEEIVRWIDLENERSGLPDYENLLAPTYGVINQSNELLFNYRLDSKNDVQSYLEMLVLLADSLKQSCLHIEEQAEQGNPPSSDCIENALTQCMKWQENGGYREVWETKLEETLLSDSQKTAYAGQREEIWQNRLSPAIQSVQSFLEEMNQGTQNVGLAQKEDGLAYYENRIRERTGVDTDVDTLIAWLEKKANSLFEEMQNLFQEDDSLQSWYAQGAQMSRSFASAQEMADFLQEEVAKRLPEVADHEYELILRDADTLDANIMAYYTQSPVDTEKLDTITINQACDFTSLSFYLTLSHELYHFYMESYLDERENKTDVIEEILPFTGYKEGWATYSSLKSLDWLGEEENKITLYRDLYLFNETLICLSDLYINGKGWNQEQVGEYYEKYYGDGLSEEELTQLYQTCTAEPALYLPYIVGCYEWMEMENYWEEHTSDEKVTFEETALSFGKLSYESVWEKLKEAVRVSEETNGVSRTETGLGV